MAIRLNTGGIGMNFELWVVVASWLLTIALLLLLVNRKQLLEAQVSFMFMQVLTWLFGAVIVENKLIAYPVDFLNYAYRTSFSFEYFIFPAVSAIYNIHFPRHFGLLVKTCYILGIPGAITALETVIERKTEIIDYINWHWFWSFSTMTVTLLLSYWYYMWFFRRIKRES